MVVYIQTYILQNSTANVTHEIKSQTTLFKQPA